MRVSTRPGAFLTALAAALGPALVAGGCASSAPASENPFESSSPSQITIEVLNLNWSDATLYAHRGGDRVRLGIVPGKGEETFSMRWNFSLPLEIEINLLAGNRCFTRPLSTDPGDIIELQIPIDMSTDRDCRPRR